MSSAAVGASSIIETAAIGNLAGNEWPIKVGTLPPLPDAVISIVDGPGQAPNPKWLIDYPTFQVVVRAGPNDYDIGYAKAEQIKDVLLGMDAQEVGTDRWDGCTMLGDLNFLGEDDKSRPRFTMNFRLIVERPANALTKREPLPLT